MLLPPDPKSPESPTTPISRDEIQIGLLNKLVSSVTDLRSDVADVKTDVADVKTDVKNVEHNLGLVSNDLGLVKERITLVEKRQDDVEKRADANEKRADANSIRVKMPSQVDLETQAQVAQQITAREELARKVDAILAPDGPLSKLAEKVDDHATKLVDVTTKVVSVEKKTDAQTVKLTDVTTKVDSVEKKTDAQTVILNRIDVLAKNPIVKAVGLALVMALAQWLGTKGIHVALPQ